MSDSIFELSNRFAYDSPFANWLQADRDKQQERMFRQLGNLQPDRVYTAPRHAPTASPTCPSMLTLSAVVNPVQANHQPGSADLAIQMTYRTVTEGPGAVDRLDLMAPTEFHDLYARGNGTYPLKTLPAPNVGAEALSTMERRWLERTHKDTGHLLYTNYYNVDVTYNFSLSKPQNFKLWDAILWLKECPESRGLFFVIPFMTEVEAWVKRGSLTTKAVLRELPPAEREAIKALPRKERKEQLEALLRKKIAQTTIDLEAVQRVYVLYHILNDNRARYTQKHLVVSEGNYVLEPYYDAMLADPMLGTLLTELGATLHRETKAELLDARADLLEEDLEEVENFYTYVIEYMNAIVFFGARFYSSFEDQFSDNKTGAAGSNPTVSNALNIVVLNHKFYGRASNGQPFEFGNLTSNEVLVHEAGHNAADLFVHSNTDYEYTDKGLSSNQRGKVYPTEANTFDILNDPTNRSYMTVK